MIITRRHQPSSPWYIPISIQDKALQGVVGILRWIGVLGWGGVVIDSSRQNWPNPPPIIGCDDKIVTIYLIWEDGLIMDGIWAWWDDDWSFDFVLS